MRSNEIVGIKPEGIRAWLALVSQLDHRTKPCNFVMLLPRIKTEPTGRG